MSAQGSAPGSAPRATLDLRVRVWGMGANNQPFFQNAVAQNISSTGACIYGIEQELKVGDVIGVQYDTRKARCKVIWVVDAGGLKKMQVGVQLVTDQECPWLAMVPEEAHAHGARTPSPDNRRHFVRHKVSFPLELRDERVNMPMRVNASDVSGSGCYVETVMPLAMATALKIDLWIGEEHISTPAIVRTRDPGVGMGIEFTGMTNDTKLRLQAYLDEIDEGLSAAAPKPEN
jgi:PilZ domain